MTDSRFSPFYLEKTKQQTRQLANTMERYLVAQPLESAPSAEVWWQGVYELLAQSSVAEDTCWALLSEQGLVLGLNSALAGYLGQPAEAWEGKPLARLAANPLWRKGARLLPRWMRRHKGTLVWLETLPDNRVRRWECSPIYVSKDTSITYLQIIGYTLGLSIAPEQTYEAAQDLFEIAQEGILLYDQQGKILTLNQAAEHITGYSKDALVTRPIGQLISPKTAQRQRRIYRKDNQKYIALEIKHGGAAKKYVEASLRPYRYGDALVNLVTFWDITEQEHTLEQLRQNEERYRLLVENASDLIYKVDVQGRCTYTNPAIQKILGYQEEEFLGVENIFTLLREDYLLFIQGFYKEQLQQGRSNTYIELPFYHKEKRRTVWLGQSAHLTYDADKQPYFQMLARDITSRRTVEYELRRAKQTIEESIAEKERFISIVGHEIRTPLQAIMGLTELMLSEEQNPEHVEFLQSILFSANNLVTLIQDLLDFSSLDSGKFKFSQVVFDLPHLFKRLKHGFMLKARENRNDLLIQIDPQVPHHLVGDSARLIQILFNLIGNALKFTKDGHVKVDVRLDSKTDTQAEVVFKIADTGIGIPEDKISRIFDYFTQASPDIFKRYGGSGLGLGITKALIERQNGSIHVQSREGIGSVFTVKLPFEIAPGGVAGEAELPPKRNPEVLQGRRILVAEDNVMNQKIINKLLSKWGIVVDLVDTGAAVADSIQQEAYDLVLLDIQLPIMNGYEVAQQIRTEQLLPQTTSILAMSAASDEETVRRALQSGMNGFIKKPFHVEELKNKLIDTLIHLPLTGNAQGLNGKELVASPSQGSVRYVDFEYLNDLTDGSQELCEEISRIFIENAPQAIEAMRQSLSQEHFEQLRKQAHKARPLFHTIGVHQANELLSEIEGYRQTPPDLAFLSERLEAIAQIYTQVCVELEDWKKNV
ncbi:PAS domain-containing hybrid sensor histidine kinase/response regulator [Eisenibacter elegans]|uniref:PAS domain-containing hybrid sensor histidine kinase/response regulator n=1 Tax=Eisenibacter elegans TaxID=997 RepID=UPI000421C078|nr:PAS domain-containing hybrid sensor histidine kinase/response regulator [Eisenibacter elegans]